MYFAPLQVGSQVFQDAVASGINNPTLETLDEEALLWNVEISELVVVSLGTGLESLALLRNNPGNEEAATMLQEKLSEKRSPSQWIVSNKFRNNCRR